jgi:hypothetical protein
MELSRENLKKPRYWLELPLEIGRAVVDETLRAIDVVLAPKETEDK